MAYTPFDTKGPQPSQSRGPILSTAKLNLLTIRNMLAMFGFVQGFNYSWTGGTAEFPTTMLFTRSTEIVKVNITYKTSTKLNASIPTKYAFYYSSDTGSNYDPIADERGYYILNLSYNLNDAVAGSRWSLA
jgi:hypothetical protein